MTNLCNVNGEVVPETAASIPVLDRGFLFGDSIYEVIRTRQGIPFGWTEHLDRLHASAAGLEMEISLTDQELTRRIVDTMAAATQDDAEHQESYVRIVITRGVGTAPNIDVRTLEGGNTCLIMVRRLPEGLDQPTTVAIVPRLRNDRRALDPAIKSGNYLNNVMGLKEARERGAAECLFMNADGKLTEASTSNVWIVQGDTVITPALRAGLLAGVTRRLLLDHCKSLGIPCMEQDLQLDDVAACDGMFLTSTLRDIAPVSAIDGRALPANPLVDQLVASFTAFCDERARTQDQAAIEELLRG